MTLIFFIDDVLPKVELVSLRISKYQKVSAIKLKYKLDFDDSYQTSVADSFGLTIATLDKDYKKIASGYKVEFVE